VRSAPSAFHSNSIALARQCVRAVRGGGAAAGQLRGGHGCAITDDIAAFAAVRFAPCSLYGAIARLESRGLIEALASADRRNPIGSPRAERRRCARGGPAFMRVASARNRF